MLMDGEDILFYAFVKKQNWIKHTQYYMKLRITEKELWQKLYA